MSKTHLANDRLEEEVAYDVMGWSEVHFLVNFSHKNKED
jgi:hypothetical protein